MMAEGADRCPECGRDIGLEAHEANVWAGDEWECPDCGTPLLVSEGTDGWSDWRIFEAVEVGP